MSTTHETESHSEITQFQKPYECFPHAFVLQKQPKNLYA